MTPLSARDSKRTRSEQLRRRVLAGSACFVLLFIVWALGPAQAEYVPMDLGSACNAYNDAFNASFDPPVSGGLYTYYEEPFVIYTGVPFHVKLPTDPASYNIVSTPIHETAVVSFPIPADNLRSIYFLGVGTWLADYLGHQHLWCDDPGHVWFRVRYEDGSSEDLFPVNVETGLAEWSDILRAEGAVATFEAMPIGYVHMYRLTLQDKVATGLELHDNCADPAGQFIVLAMTAETREPVVAEPRVAFVSDRGGSMDIWTMDADGSDLSQLTTNPGLDEQPVASPDGRRIAYVSDAGNPAYGSSEVPNTDVWVMDVDGSGKVRLSSFGTYYCSQPAWSPDGEQIVFAAQNDHRYLYGAPSDGSSPPILLEAGVGPYDMARYNPEFSPDGTCIIYDCDSSGGGWWDLYRRAMPDGPEEPLATVSHSIGGGYSHTGDRIAYIQDVPPNSQVRMMNADGSNNHLLIDNSAIAYDGWGQVTWSPDDALLAVSVYSSQHPGAPDFHQFIQILDAETGAEVYRTTSSRNMFAYESSLYCHRRFVAGNQVWSRDSSQLLFMSDDDGNWDVCTMAADGADQANLTQSPAYDGDPCWIFPTISSVTGVEIDIKPGSERNPVNPKSQGVLPVAVFSSSTFDATDVDPSTVLLAGAPVAQNPDDGGWMIHEGDENGDGLMDVRLHFETEDIDVELLVDGEYAILTGITFGDIEFMGWDNVTIVPKDLTNDHWALEEIAECIAGEIVQGYPDGSYLPEVKVSRAQMAAFVSRAHAGGDNAVPEGPAEATFPDVPTDHWAYDYVEYASANAIVTGYSGGAYQPSWIVNRGQMAVFIARAEDWVSLDDDLATAPELFLDVPAGYWAGKAIEACVSHGVVQGYSDGSYRPTAAVTRDQMAVYIARAFELAT